jgi:hypothetical protein
MCGEAGARYLLDGFRELDPVLAVKRDQLVNAAQRRLLLACNLTTIHGAFNNTLLCSHKIKPKARAMERGVVRLTRLVPTPKTSISWPCWLRE